MPTNIRQQQTPQEIRSNAPRNDAATDEIMTVADVAALLKCKSSSVYNLTRRRGRARYEISSPRAMRRRAGVLLTLIAASLASAWAKTENWLEVRSPHFLVVTNSSEKQARRVADQFERMRSVFHTLFPKLQIDPGAPILVLAIKDEKDFRALEPTAYLAKGSLRLGGLFLRTPDKNYVLMRLDAEGEHPYSIVYHEYTHLLLSKTAEWMPLWMNEGLAEFYENTDIHEKDVALGQPSPESLEFLRQNRMIPLTTLFTVDSSSPYYHEENKGSIFYAESWALTHYLEQKDYRDKTHRLTDYTDLLAKKVDPVAAAAQAFGDLKQLQAALDSYVRQASYAYFKMSTLTEVDDSAFQMRSLTLPQADAVRADFLAYEERTADAKALLDRILQEDPSNVSAHETNGFLAFRQGHIDEARKWYSQAVQLDSQSYLAHYYFAAIAMNGSVTPEEESGVETSLRSAIKLNPAFAPAYERLGVFLATHRHTFDDARLQILNAVQLDPGNFGYRMNVANILMQMGRGKDAVSVVRQAMHLAKPEETTLAHDFLQHAEEYAAMQEESRRFTEQVKGVAAGTDGSVNATSTVDASSLSHRAPSDEVLPTGPHHFLTGVLKNVRCDSPTMDLSVVSRAKTLDLHSANYYKIQFTALNFKPQGDLNPCKDLEGMSAKVEFVESSSKPSIAHIVGIELHK